MAKQLDSISRIDAHERECAIRYQNIESRLNEGSYKFKKIEWLLWGLYGALAASMGLDKIF